MKRNAFKEPTHLASLLILVVSFACASNPGTTKFSNPQFDFGYLERLAVLPLESLSDDSAAGQRVARMLTTELLASGAVDVVEPGEVQAALDRIPGGGLPPSTEQVIELGKMLGVQGVIVGSIAQSEVLRSGTVSYPVVTIDLHLLETDSGAAVWAATHTEQGSTASAKFLGTGAVPISATTRKCVREILKTLLG